MDNVPGSRAARPSRWLRPRSVRGQIVALVTLIAIVILVPAAVAGDRVARMAVANGIWQQSRQQAAVTAAAVREGRMTATITPSVTGVDLVQVVAPDNRVIAASPEAHGLGPLTRARPSAEDPQQDVQFCDAHQRECVRIAAVRVSPAPDSPVVYAGRASPTPVSTAILDALFAAQAAVLVGLAAWAAWAIAGRVLAPVEGMRSRLAEINGQNLTMRVPESGGQDEIAGLARAINATLQRLEHAKTEQEHAMTCLEGALRQQRRFTTDASHELRTPLAGLRAQLEGAQLHPDDTDVPGMIADALRDVDRLQAIISDLMLLARPGEGDQQMQEVDLSVLVQKELARRVNEPHPVATDLRPGAWVRANPVQISRILTNLLDNAQRHAASAIRVHVDHVPGPPAPDRNGANALDGESGEVVELSVIDDGPGIPEREREFVFQRFSRLDTARGRGQGGTGLGLAIARDLAHAHHGTLHAQDPPGGRQGACLVLRLPAVDPPAAPQP